MPSGSLPVEKNPRRHKLRRCDRAGKSQRDSAGNSRLRLRHAHRRRSKARARHGSFPRRIKNDQGNSADRGGQTLSRPRDCTVGAETATAGWPAPQEANNNKLERRPRRGKPHTRRQRPDSVRLCPESDPKLLFAPISRSGAYGARTRNLRRDRAAL